MTPIKTAVIGVGYLGRFHAQKFQQLPQSELVAVVDVDPQSRERVAQELGVPGISNYREILDQVDAVSIVVPTQYHYQVAKDCLDAGLHILLEKPFAATLEEARALLEQSQHSETCFQIGHLERFNPAYLKYQNYIEAPQFIECTRIAPFPKRGTDVDVILDLMIHDIDLVLNLTQELPSHVEGMGVSVLTPSTDLANVRLQFPSGCVANLTASRVSANAERKMRVFQKGLYLSLNLGEGEAKFVQIPQIPVESMEQLIPQTDQLEKGDALLSEVKHFLECIQQQNSPKVTAKDGLQAMEIAFDIKEQIRNNFS